MRKKNQYNLGEAVKEFYQTEPLQRDLATTVANKIFPEKPVDSFVLDKILLIMLCFILVASFIYVYGFLTQVSLGIILLFLIAIAGLISLSIKEHLILLKRIKLVR